jgi:hypothetical protein
MQCLNYFIAFQAETTLFHPEERVLRKAHQLIDQGIVKPRDLQVLLDAYVRNELFDTITMPKTTNARYFPSIDTLRNVIYK